MIGKLLCKIRLHKWEKHWRPSKCSYYPFDILVSRTCKRCDRVEIAKEKPHDNHD